MLYLPSSALVPYTTLFRSQRLGDLLVAGGDVDLVQVVGEVGELALVGAAGDQRGHHVGADVAHRAQPVADVVADGVDRKSTRLNSSHVAISYAVFCLKRKN